MSRQMATMISSGLSLLRALSILSAQTENKKLAGILQQVTVDVENGGSLSDSFAKHPVDFPPLMINMIRAGETGGFLEGALESLAVNYEKEAKLRSAIKSAMAYPVMVLVMSFVAVHPDAASSSSRSSRRCSTASAASCRCRRRCS